MCVFFKLIKVQLVMADTSLRLLKITSNLLKSRLRFNVPSTREREHMKKKPDLLILLYLAFGAGLLISSIAQSGLL